VGSKGILAFVLLTPAVARPDAAAAAPASAPVCGYWSAPTPELARSCADIDKLALSSPTIGDADAGSVSPGQRATVRLVMTNHSTRGYSAPCVAFSSDDPGVTISPNPSVSVYVLPPGASASFTALATVASSVRSGAVLHFTARAGVPSSDCSRGATLGWDVRVHSP
jgi:hypothetical protein